MAELIVRGVVRTMRVEPQFIRPKSQFQCFDFRSLSPKRPLPRHETIKSPPFAGAIVVIRPGHGQNSHTPRIPVCRSTEEISLTSNVIRTGPICLRTAVAFTGGARNKNAHCQAYLRLATNPAGWGNRCTRFLMPYAAHMPKMVQSCSTSERAECCD